MAHKQEKIFLGWFDKYKNLIFKVEALIVKRTTGPFFNRHEMYGSFKVRQHLERQRATINSSTSGKTPRGFTVGQHLRGGHINQTSGSVKGKAGRLGANGTGGKQCETGRNISKNVFRHELGTTGNCRLVAGFNPATRSHFYYATGS